MKYDFKNVLQASIQKQWDEVRRAMSSFSYFESLDDLAKREGCIVAKMRSFEQNETLLGDGSGVPNFVYFILSGQCQMIESIQVHVKKRNGKEFFSLYDPYVIPPEESEHNLDKYFLQYQKKIKEMARKSSETTLEGVSSKEESILSNNMSIKSKSLQNIKDEAVKEKKIGTQEIDEKNSEDNVDQKTSRLPINGDGIRTYFMQVCLLKAGACFGFGENMRDRRIVALNHVDCMLLPKLWLLQRNTSNIWTRIQYYLENKIPSKKEMFHEFVTNRQWQHYRTQVVNEVTNRRSKAINKTTIHDVPYSIRMDEVYDI